MVPHGCERVWKHNQVMTDIPNTPPLGPTASPFSSCSHPALLLLPSCSRLLTPPVSARSPPRPPSCVSTCALDAATSRANWATTNYCSAQAASRRDSVTGGARSLRGGRITSSGVRGETLGRSWRGNGWRLLWWQAICTALCRLCVMCGVYRGLFPNRG